MDCGLCHRHNMDGYQTGGLKTMLHYTFFSQSVHMEETVRFIVVSKRDLTQIREGLNTHDVVSIHVGPPGSEVVTCLVKDVEDRVVTTDTGYLVVDDSSIIKMLAEDQARLAHGNDECVLARLRCAACGGTPRKLLTCSRCMKRRYCDRKCQQSHWRVHKSECIQ